MTSLHSPVVYIWGDIPNWGDRLGSKLFNYFFGRKFSFAQTNDIQKANLIGLGSTLGHIPEDWEGIIAGTGSLKIAMRPWKAQILGLRGCVSMYSVGYHEHIVYGDPGLITPRVLTDLEVTSREYYLDRADIGILPHWSDTRLKHDSRFYGPWKTKFISPFQNPIDVVRQIISCDKIVTSSLHGTVIADAYGIPRRIVPAWSMLNDPNEGGMFKFQDYMSVLNMEYQPEVLEKADRTRVEKIQEDVYKLYEKLPTYFNETNTSNN